MFKFIMMFLFAASASLQGANENVLLAGDVSPAQQSEADADDTGEVDEDIIITEDEDSNDDEGVSN